MENSVINITGTAPRFLILAGDGINCERETAAAFTAAGGKADIVHINELIETPKNLDRYDGLALPGGFSFGDELGSGQLLALKIRYQLADAFKDFVAAGKPVIGICNGFQVLVKLGLLPFPDQTRKATLTANTDGHFIDRWVKLQTAAECLSPWIKNLPPVIELPVRHGEGRLVLKPGAEEALYRQLSDNGQIPFYYQDDINGSYKNIAGLCDPSGLVLGMMPHPEAFLYNATYRNIHADPQGWGQGYFLFRNILRYLGGQEDDQSEEEGQHYYAG